MNAADNAVGSGKEIRGGMRIFFLHSGDWKLLRSHVNHNITKASNANSPSIIH